MGLRLPPFIELPFPESKKLLGIDPTVITREDMTSSYAWYRLAVSRDMYLDEWDFRDRDMFDKYFLLSLGLLEFPVALMGGDPKSGKSMGQAWIAHKIAKLFGKRATLDHTVPYPEYYRPYNSVIRLSEIGKELSTLDTENDVHKGRIKALQEERVFLELHRDAMPRPYFLLQDKGFAQDIVDEYNRLTELQAEVGQITDGEWEKLITYNTVFDLDECDSYALNTRRTNVTVLLSMIASRRRHTKTCMFLAMINIERFDLLIKEHCTHKINCVWQGHMPDACSILIEDVRPGGTGIKKWLVKRPKDLLHLWDSHNISPLTHDIPINFGQKKKKKEEVPA